MNETGEVSNSLDNSIHFTEQQIEGAKNQSTEGQKLRYFGNILTESLGLDSNLTPEFQKGEDIVGIPVDKVRQAYKSLFNADVPSMIDEQFEAGLRRTKEPGMLSYSEINTILETGAGGGVDSDKVQNRQGFSLRSAFNKLLGK